jgi:hypothetical protein
MGGIAWLASRSSQDKCSKEDVPRVNEMLQPTSSSIHLSTPHTASLPHDPFMNKIEGRPIGKVQRPPRNPFIPALESIIINELVRKEHDILVHPVLLVQIHNTAFAKT